MSPDCAIKLFGKTITLLPDEKVLSHITVAQQSSSAEFNLHDTTKDVYEESANPSESTTTSSDEMLKNDVEKPTDSTTTLKKPEKLLPCPRCKSSDTKFCYYNNYNVKQPRHFCKKCQRYWTSGGTMRNVPVGSGRRKNKNVLREARPEPTNGFLVFGPNNEHSGRVLGPLGFPFTFYPAAAYWGPPVPIPKTFMIDDPNEAARSSVWTALGVENEKLVGSGGGKKMRLFEAFETKGGRSNRSVDNTTTTMAFYANPAALSRSFNFHES